MFGGFLRNWNKSLARVNARDGRHRGGRPLDARIRSKKRMKLKIKPGAQNQVISKPKVSGGLLQVPGLGLPVKTEPNAEQKANLIAQIGGTQLRKRGPESNNSVSRGY